MDPALRLLTNTNLHFVSMLLVYSAGAGLSVFKGVLRDQKGFSVIENVLSKYSINSLCYHHQNTRKPYSHLGIQIKHSRSLKMSLQSAKPNVKKPGGPTAFCKRGLYCQRKSKCIARAPSSRFFSKNGDCFQ